jgi:beta-phosphoglucomutase
MERNNQVKLIYGIAFDLEGTIINLEPLHHIAHLKAAKDAGINLTWDEAFHNLPHFIGGPDDKVAEEISLITNMKYSTEEVLQVKKKYFEELLLQTEKIILREGFLKFLAWIRSKQIIIAIGSVTNGEQIEYLLSKSGLNQEFTKNQIVSREDVNFPKPNPEVYIKTSQKMGILPANQLVIEDSLTGVRSAKAAGCRIIAMPTITTASYSDSLLKEGAEAVFKSWSDPDLKQFLLNSLP